LIYSFSPLSSIAQSRLDNLQRGQADDAAETETTMTVEGEGSEKEDHFFHEVTVVFDGPLGE